MIIHSASDKLVFNILNRINYGFLEITSFDGYTLKFGNPEDNLKANLIIKKPNFTYNDASSDMFMIKSTSPLNF